MYITQSQRCSESLSLRFSSDIHYSASLEGCSDCLFCFNLNGRRKSIGNLELQPEKYAELKKKLLSEALSFVKEGKMIPSLLHMIEELPREPLGIKTYETNEKLDMAPIDAAFRDTFRILFKKGDPRLDDYSGYLAGKMSRINALAPSETASNKEQLLLEDYKQLFRIKHRGISWIEGSALSNAPRTLSVAEVEILSFNDASNLSKIAFVPLDYVVGKNSNVGKAEFYMNANDCYHGVSFIFSKYSAFCWWPRESSHAFGSTILLNSSFCIGSHYSTKLTRAFEADSCTNCSDIYFAHNCENVHNSMFCFNAKNLRHAIGNTELPMEQYKQMKDLLVGQIADELISKKDLKWNIYNIGCHK